MASTKDFIQNYLTLACNSYGHPSKIKHVRNCLNVICYWYQTLPLYHSLSRASPFTHPKPLAVLCPLWLCVLCCVVGVAVFGRVHVTGGEGAHQASSVQLEGGATSRAKDQWSLPHAQERRWVSELALVRLHSTGGWLS